MNFVSIDYRYAPGLRCFLSTVAQIFGLAGMPTHRETRILPSAEWSEMLERHSTGWSAVCASCARGMFISLSDQAIEGALPGNIVIVGHSLGTGIAAALAAQLSLECVLPASLILIAPYTSIKDLLGTYRPGGRWAPPVFAPLSWFPSLQCKRKARQSLCYAESNAAYLLGRMNTQFNTEKTIVVTVSSTHCHFFL